jgi:hypothetical protein
MLIVYGVRINPCFIARRVNKVANDDTARAYPACPRELDSGFGVVERRVSALALQKSVSDACSIVIFPYDVVLRVTPSSKRKRRARKVDSGVRPVVEKVSLTLCSTCSSTNVRVSTDDCARRANSAGRAAGCAGWIEKCEDAFLGPYKTVEGVSIARVAAGRVGTGIS